MPILNFNSKFADKVRSGRKRQTIRAFRKYPIEPWDNLFLYTGLRTRGAEKLRESQCTNVRKIQIRAESIVIDDIFLIVTIGRIVLLENAELDRFAREDGFKSWEEMKAWWLRIHGLPFTGTLIEWV